MRAREFINEDSGATCSGNIATMAVPMGEVISRQFDNFKTKYANAYKKPWVQRKLKNARK
jgi:hypothetical protein